MRLLLKILKITAYSIIGLLLTYAVVFSLASTAAIVYAGMWVYKPISDVKRLVHENPAESAYMASLRKATGNSDTLLHTFVPYDSISHSLVVAVVASEDDGFWVHPGFDLNAIAAAFERNRISGKIEFGGSTITQQLAKNLFLSSDKSFGRKFQELGYAVLMEKYLGKERILELYLNYAQWGKNIFGCEAASQANYGKSCRNLSMWEAARLASVLARPSKSDPNNARSVFVGKRLQVIADNLYTKKLIDETGYTGLTGKEAPRKDTAQVPVAPDSPEDGGSD